MTPDEAASLYAYRESPQWTCAWLEHTHPGWHVWWEKGWWLAVRDEWPPETRPLAHEDSWRLNDAISAFDAERSPAS